MIIVEIESGVVGCCDWVSKKVNYGDWVGWKFVKEIELVVVMILETESV